MAWGSNVPGSAYADERIVPDGTNAVVPVGGVVPAVAAGGLPGVVVAPPVDGVPPGADEGDGAASSSSPHAASSAAAPMVASSSRREMRVMAIPPVPGPPRTAASPIEANHIPVVWSSLAWYVTVFRDLGGIRPSERSGRDSSRTSRQIPPSSPRTGLVGVCRAIRTDHTGDHRPPPHAARITMTAPDDIVATCRETGVRLIRFLYCDNGGVVRGKVVPVEQLAERMSSGVGLTVAMQAMNSLDQLQAVEG